MRKKIVLLGSGELGKEFVIACQRLGQYVVAVDSYAGAPAMQVAHEFEVIDMLDGDALDRIIAKHQPDLIVPEIEAIRTERFYAYEAQGIQVVPSAKAANFTMNRKAIRDLAAIEVGVKTATYRYATSFEELKAGVAVTGIPCVVKPLMSSSGKGQSVIKSEADIEKAWNYALEGSRGDLKEVIVEGFIDFDYEITLLTIRAKNANGEIETSFCAPIGHLQKRGDYVESWQPQAMTANALKESQRIAKAVTDNLGGLGLFGVELFVKGDHVWFSEVSPRPHDTGMVTMATQRFNEFELHARAILGLPVNAEMRAPGASAVIYGGVDSKNLSFEGVEKALAVPESDIRLFGKPESFERRRMGVALATGKDVDEARARATLASSLVKTKAE